MIEMTRERYQQGGGWQMAAELGTKDKKKRRKKANKPSNSNLALLLYKDKITKPPHTVCVHLGKGERCRKGGRYRQGVLYAYSLAERQV